MKKAATAKWLALSFELAVELLKIISVTFLGDKRRANDESTVTPQTPSFLNACHVMFEWVEQ